MLEWREVRDPSVVAVELEIVTIDRPEDTNGEAPLGVEGAEDVADRHRLLRAIGYKL